MTTQASVPATVPDLKFHPDFDLARADAMRATLQRTLAGEKPIARNATVYGARSIIVDGADALEFIGVTEPMARDGDIVRVDGIQLTSLAADPVLLWSHDYEGERPPIGRIISTNRETDPTLGRIFTFRAIPALIDGVDHEHLDFVRLIWGYYKQRFLNSVSYGWRIVEARPITDAQGFIIGLEHIVTEALEFSGCNVGSDRNAVQRLIQQGQLPEKYVGRFMGPAFRNAPAYEIRETPPAGFVWREQAAPKVETPPIIPVVERGGGLTIPALDPVAPSVMELRLTGGESLGQDIVAQLRAALPALLEEFDPQTRKGAAISKRNREKLQAAQGHLDQCTMHAENMRASAQACMDVIGEVLTEAQKPVEEDPSMHTVAADDPPTPPEPSRIETAIDDLSRAVPRPRSLLDAIDDLTKPRAAPSAAQTNFDRVLADIAARASTDAARSAATP